MPWLNVPHLQQTEPGWCLPACIVMVAAYWQQPLLQADVAEWLGAQGFGVPASRVERLTRRGFQVLYRTGSLAELENWIAKSQPCILFVRTGELPYWEIDTPHAVVRPPHGHRQRAYRRPGSAEMGKTGEGSQENGSAALGSGDASARDLRYQHLRGRGHLCLARTPLKVTSFPPPTTPLNSGLALQWPAAACEELVPNV